MATWPGWQVDLMQAANLPNQSGNRNFLNDWHAAETSSCRNNPVDISRGVANSTTCHKLTAIRTARNYRTPGNASAAFARQLRSGNYPHLLAALESGAPYSVGNPKPVIDDLALWGSLAFVFELQQDYPPHPSEGGGSGGGPYAPRATKGWDDFRGEVNHGLPTMLRRVGALNRATSRTLTRRRRMRH